MTLETPKNREFSAFFASKKHYVKYRKISPNFESKMVKIESPKMVKSFDHSAKANFAFILYFHIFIKIDFQHIKMVKNFDH